MNQANNPDIALFVGGPWDGRMVQLQRGAFAVQCHERRMTDYQAPLEDIEPSVTTCTYKRYSLLGYAFMVADKEIPPIDVHVHIMDALRRGYRRV